MGLAWYFIIIGGLVGVVWIFLRKIDTSIQRKMDVDLRLFESSPEIFTKLKSINLNTTTIFKKIDTKSTLKLSINGVEQTIDTSNGVSESVIAELAQKMKITEDQLRKLINGDLSSDSLKELDRNFVKHNDVDEKFLKQDETINQNIKDKQAQHLKDSFKKRLKDI